MNTGYYVTNSVKLLMTQSDCKQLILLCQSVYELCHDYMIYCWKQLQQHKKINRNEYYKKYLKKLHKEYKDDPESIYYYARLSILSKYFNRIESVGKSVYKNNKPIYGDKFISQLSHSCKNIDRLIGKKKSYLTLPASNKNLTISKINEQGTVSINGVRKKIPFQSHFTESIIGDDHVTWMVFEITHKEHSLISVSMTLICGTQKKPYFDKDGFYNLIKKEIK